MAKQQVEYKNFSPNGPPGNGNVANSQWWKMENDLEKQQAIAGTISYLAEHSTGVEQQRQISRRLYGNYSIMGTNGLSFSKIAQSQPKANDRITYNVVQSAVDTVVAKMSKNRPKPMFLTSGGDWKLQRKAKKLEKFTEGIFYENAAYDMGPAALLTAMVDGTCAVQVFEDQGRVRWERVLISEIYVDEIEAFYGKPRQLHRVRNIDRAVLTDMFPEHKEVIANVNGSLSDTVGSYQSIGDQVTVAESWHLPSGPDATDGSHVISINGAVLLDEEWEHSDFPFVFLHWSKRLYGFWAQGAAEQIQNIQLEINKLLWVIQRSMHLAGTFKVALENSSKIVKEHLNNDIGAIITYTNNPPQYLVPPVVPPEYYQHLLTLKAAAYDQLGVSELSATSEKPAGLNSGKALREYNDIESDRFQIIGQAYENFFLELSKHSIAVAKSIAETQGGFSINVPGKRFIETIDWEDVSLKDDEYVLKLYPVSSLPTDPEGRLQTIQEYAQAGFLSPQSARRLLDFPDLEAVEEMANAPEDRIHRVLESMIDDGEYTPPDEYMPLDLARTLGLQYYNHAVNCDIPEDRLEMIRTFMDQISALEQQMNPPAPPQAPGQPQANPTPTPQSDLIPNTPGQMPPQAA